MRGGTLILPDGVVAGDLAVAQGRIVAVGRNADLALVDLDHEATLTAADLAYRHPISPYVGQRLRGRVVQTLVRGQTIQREGRIVAATRGQFLHVAPMAR